MSNKKLIGLIKYVKSEYAEDFENGKIFFNGIRNYNKLDEKYIGDKDEGKVVEKKNPDDHILIVRVLGSENSHIISNLTSLKHSFTHPYYDDVKISCFTCIFDDDIEKLDDHQEEREIFRFKKEFLENLVEYESERKIYICTNMTGFLSSIINNIDSSKQSFKSGIVNYYSEKNSLYDKFREDNIEEIDLINAVFEKNIKFKHQKEFRILITNLKDKYIEVKEMNDYWHEVSNLNDINIAFNSNG